MTESQLGWGDSSSWSSRDFNTLSERILESTGVNLNAITLKRIWGRVHYTSTPSTTTLDALAQFNGYKGWRDFRTQQPTSADPLSADRVNAGPVGSSPPIEQPQPANAAPVIRGQYTGRPAYMGAGLGILLIAAIVFAAYRYMPGLSGNNAAAVGFTSKVVVAEGVPNSVVFDIDARKTGVDSVTLQQSWDERLQVNLPKHQRQHTAIYYYPGSFTAKLLVGGRVARQHHLLINSDGWLPLVEQMPVPVYLERNGVLRRGRMEVGPDRLKTMGFSLASNPPFVAFYHTRDFGEVYADDFTFETSFRNLYAGGAGACQKTYVLLQCIGHAIWIPLCSKGCISESNLSFIKYGVLGRTTDLSNFGVDFSSDVKLRIHSSGGKAQIYVNDRLAHVVQQGIERTKVVGVCFRFQGGGSVDYVRLTSGGASFEDKF